MYLNKINVSFSKKRQTSELRLYLKRKNREYTKDDSTDYGGFVYGTGFEKKYFVQQKKMN